MVRSVIYTPLLGLSIVTIEVHTLYLYTFINMFIYVSQVTLHSRFPLHTRHFYVVTSWTRPVPPTLSKGIPSYRLDNTVPPILNGSVSPSLGGKSGFFIGNVSGTPSSLVLFYVLVWKSQSHRPYVFRSSSTSWPVPAWVVLEHSSQFISTDWNLGPFKLTH